MGYWIEIELFVVWNRPFTKKSLIIFSYVDDKKAETDRGPVIYLH